MLNKLQIMFKENKAFFLFLIKFLATYFLLTLLYSVFIGGKKVDNFKVDKITEIVSNLVEKGLVLINDNYTIEKSKTEAAYIINYNKFAVSRIIEGCNAISVQILFLSFIFAFSAGLKRTFLFMIFGVLLVFILNIVRIILIVLLINKFPEFQNFLHDILFPVIIYGILFYLWFLWIFKFSKS